MKRDFQLGRYEDVRGPTATGRYRVYWSVKPKYRIDGWPEPVNLTSEPGQGYLDDPVEVQRIVDRMAELNDEFDDRRRQASVQKAEPPRTFARIAKLWTESAFFQTVSKGRQAQYKGVVKAVTKAFPADLMADLTTSQLTRFVESQKEGRRRKFKNDLCQLYELAIGERWTQINPAKKIKYAGQGQRRNVDLWSEDDRDRFVAEARDKGLHGLAGIVQLGWLTGHRRGDLLGARRFIHYAYPNFNYKTQNSVAANQPRWVNVRLPNWMADVIDASRSTRHDFLFENSLTGRPYTVAQFEDHFNYIRGRVQPEGDKHLQFKNLRKSLVVRLAESDVSLLGICAVTGHSPVSAAQIMRYYYIPTDEASHAAIQKDHQRRGGGGIRMTMTSIPSEWRSSWMDRRTRSLC